MAKKSTPQSWNLTVTNVARRSLFNLVEAWKPESRRESKEQVLTMEALEASDDFTLPAPGLDAGGVNRLAELLLRFGVSEPFVETLAEDLKRMPAPPKTSTTVRITLTNIETVLDAFDAAVRLKSVNGAVARQVMPYISAMEQAREGKGIDGVLESAEVEEESPAQVAS